MSILPLMHQPAPNVNPIANQRGTLALHEFDRAAAGVPFGRDTIPGFPGNPVPEIGAA
jgi:hypothetical protein